ncbi:GNAT family N-acetyltransferase [Ensifer adhaerens]|uniref:GNAT family N-acetyltransferase n=1 Tax=Ensifer adhaerens TaxID=106592 RepID=UPI001CBD75CB|nr:GNAT family N-acetyltransferase [Ensifer adhaerens]MBZ7921726.1 GNAT family N-acetyltransferase [Ensifer adhaerens]UAX94134.1 GNAT family N-acetyltransferase [Ensifer adhaerens]UAY01768.1 GNAT family N-acetyltransferase [Ensifer adhaerens]UAY09152.1 GNAT family N-acetyltransferase [Ensifer adhaerens]
MLIRAAIQDDLPVICEIYNDAVANTTAIWNETLVDVANRAAWLKARTEAGYPVLVAVSDEGDVIGYASFGDWRAFDGYRHTVEHSVYVHKDRRGGGIGRKLMVALIAEAERSGKHVMVAGIESENTASIRLHAQLGFVDTGRMREVGTKFGRWLDLTFMQLVLPTGSPR